MHSMPHENEQYTKLTDAWEGKLWSWFGFGLADSMCSTRVLNRWFLEIGMPHVYTLDPAEAQGHTEGHQCADAKSDNAGELAQPLSNDSDPLHVVRKRTCSRVSSRDSSTITELTSSIPPFH